MTWKHVDFEVGGWGELAQGPSAWRSYAQAVLDLDPVAYWRCGEAEGTTAADERSAHDGSYVNGVTLGRPGTIFRDADTAAGFDGSGAHLVVGHHVALELGGPAPATWVVWAKKQSADDDDRWLLGKGRARLGQLRYMIELKADGGTIDFATNDGSWRSVTSDASLSFSGWRLIAVTWDGQDTVRFYHDGQPVGVAPFQVSWFPSATDDLMFGAARASAWNDDLFHYAGELDEIALFDAALSAEAIADLYDRAVGAFRMG